MKVHHASDEEKKVTRKQKAESKSQESDEQSPKKPKTEGNSEQANGKSNSTDIAAEFEKFCKATSEHLSIKQMREILEANGRDASVSDDAVVPRWFVK